MPKKQKKNPQSKSDIFQKMKDKQLKLKAQEEDVSSEIVSTGSAVTITKLKKPEPEIKDKEAPALSVSIKKVNKQEEECNDLSDIIRKLIIALRPILNDVDNPISRGVESNEVIFHLKEKVDVSFNNDRIDIPNVEKSGVEISIEAVSLMVDKLGWDAIEIDCPEDQQEAYTKAFQGKDVEVSFKRPKLRLDNDAEEDYFSDTDVELGGGLDFSKLL